MKNATEIYVSFVIRNFDCDPVEITRTTGVEPSKVWRKGERARPKAAPFPNNGWTLKSELPASASAMEQARDVLDRIYPVRSRLHSIGGFDAYLSIAAYIVNGDCPALFLEPEIVAQAAALQAGCDVDLYVLTAAPEADVG